MCTVTEIVGDRRWLHADERGSIVATSDGSGAMLSINKFDEFGKPQSTNAGRFQYTGQAWLPEIGLYYYKARMYAAHLPRFLQTDPIGYADSPNLYAYVLNDPVNLVDPLGLDGEEIIVIGNAIPINLLGGSALAAARTSRSPPNQDPRELSNEKIEEIVVEYWRNQKNNPVSKIGTHIGLSRGGGFWIGMSRRHLMANILNTPIESDGKKRYPTQVEAERIYHLVRWNLMIEDKKARASDQSGVRGLLSAGQIWDYHVTVFGRFGLDSSAFAGDWIFGSRRGSIITGWAQWCKSCDW